VRRNWKKLYPHTNRGRGNKDALPLIVTGRKRGKLKSSAFPGHGEERDAERQIFSVAGHDRGAEEEKKKSTRSRSYQPGEGEMQKAGSNASEKKDFLSQPVGMGGEKEKERFACVNPAVGGKRRGKYIISKKGEERKKKKGSLPSG